MATEPTPPPSGATTNWLDDLGRNREKLSYALFGAAALFALVPVWMGYKYQWEYLNVCIWGATVAIILAAAGVWSLRGGSTHLAAPDAFRLLVLIVGGLVVVGHVAQ